MHNGIVKDIVPQKVNVDIDESLVAASGVLTSDNTQVTAGKKVTIGTREYTFRAALAGGVDEVVIGADADETLTNLKTLINEGREAVAASGVLTSDETNPADADEVVIGANTYVFKTSLTEVKASGTLTSDETQPAAGDKVTIGTKVYTFVASLTSTNEKTRSTIHANPYSVLIGADADTTLGNLVAAINGDAGEGSKYAFNTPAHPDVTAAAVSSHATVVTAKLVGTAGNSIAKSETSAHLDWDGVGAVLTNGANAVVNEIKIGADADTTLGNLKAAINGESGEGTKYSTGTVASTEVTCGAVTAHAVTVTAIVAGAAGNSLAKTESSTHLDWDGAGAVMTGGIPASAAHEDVTCGDVTAHAVTVTAKVAGFAGNSIAKAEDDAHLDWDGSGAFLTGGGGTVGTYEITKDWGVARRFVTVCPQMTGTPTYTLSIQDEDGVAFYTTSALNENAITNTAYEVALAKGDKIVLTFNGAVEDTGKPVVLEIR